MADLPTNLRRLDNNSDEILALTSDIADAIVAKGGTLPVNAGLRSFADAIENIPNTYVSSTEIVRFMDYDGTILHTYAADEFLELSAMPANPTHTGLTSQGWNWTLADAKTYVAAYGKLNIGQMYITSDGKTRLYYVIPKDNLTLNLYLNLDSDTELDIDWGDGTAHTTWTSNDGDDSKSHEYSDGGRYTIAITVVGGGFSYQSSGSGDQPLKKAEFGSGFNGFGSGAFRDCHALSSITIPNTVRIITDYAFQNCYALSSVTIPNSVISIGESAFAECSALSSITIPNSVTSIGHFAFFCPALSSITIPSSVTSIGDYAFGDCYSLSSITIPSSVESIADSVFGNCFSLSSVTIPNTVTSIESNAFIRCSALSSITIPSSVTSIGDYAFGDCYSLSSITFESTTPPELDGELSISTACIIRVPEGTLSDYTSAPNYPDPSQYIYEEY